MSHAARDRALENLAYDIFRCRVVEDILDGRPSPCTELVRWQGDRRDTRWYVPEPWVGHIGTARILFIGPNPGAGDREEPFDFDRHMSRHDSDQDLLAAANGAFDDVRYPGIINGDRNRDRHGRPASDTVPYWTWTIERAHELLGREPEPGRDYAITEVVHCGCAPRNERIVRPAVPICAGRYLARVVDVSPARVIILAGAIARHRFQAEFEREFGGPIVRLPPPRRLWVWQRGLLRGVTRYVIALPHPNANGLRSGEETIVANIGPELTEEVCAFARAPDDACGRRS